MDNMTLSCEFASEIDTTTLSGINRTTQLRLDQQAANWLGDQACSCCQHVPFTMVKCRPPSIQFAAFCQTVTTASTLALINLFNSKSVLDHFNFLHNQWRCLLAMQACDLKQNCGSSRIERWFKRWTPWMDTDRFSFPLGQTNHSRLWMWTYVWKLVKHAQLTQRYSSFLASEQLLFWNPIKSYYHRHNLQLERNR